ncbi:MAG: methyltransferase family protein, partial [Promethearchaeota archaeon]
MNTSSNQNLNSSSNMTAWGIGPRMALLTTPFIVIFLTIHIAFYPIFLLPIDYIFILIIGCALIFIGLLLLLKSRKLINEAFDASELVTESIYGYIRHPVYAAFILFICPGITCLFNSWICFFIPLILYMIFRFL